MLNRPSVVELREALAALAPRVYSGDATIDSAFRNKLGAAVDELRLLGWPAEQVIVAVKQIADDAGIPASRNVLRTAGDLTPNDAALQQLVRYCIEDYYGVKLAS